jgi:hypothetical protein
MNIRDHEVIDRNGKRVTRGDVLQDGDKLVVRMNMMDGADPALAALASAAALADAVRRNEQFDASKHRPGYAGVRSAAQTDAISRAHDERDARLSNAWKKPPAATVLDTATTAVEQVAILGPQAGNDKMFEARDRIIADRDKRLEAAWQQS